MATTIFEDELTLPGVITNILNDYTSEYDQSQFGTTQSVTIIGTAFDGPVGVPTKISVPEQAKYIFGDSYDPKTRREASLVPNIYDAWDKGCRTIYAVRVSGKDIYKDYDFAIETDLRLRVRGAFPSNKNKEVFMVYETAQNINSNAGKIKIFKPATRATINEKKLGMVDNINDMLVKEIDLTGYDFNKDSKLIDVINKINSYSDNNVIHLEIVNSEGVAVDSSKEAQDLSLGVMFPGIYTLGREKTGDKIISSTNVEFVRTEKAKPYEDFDGFLWKKLTYNTDVAQPYPIYAETSQQMQIFFGEESGLVADSSYKYMKDPNALNILTVADNIDYEEVSLDPFEIYKKLGSGFCDTCMIQPIKTGEEEDDEVTHYRVIQTPETNPNKTIGIQDGLYSTLENHGTDYLVVSCVNAETSLYGGVPKKDEFKKTKKNTLELKKVGAEREDAIINAQTIVGEKDFSNRVKYAIDIKNVETLNVSEITEKIKEDKYLRVPVIDKTLLDKEYDIEDNLFALAIDCTTQFTAADLTGTEGSAEGPGYEDHVVAKCNGELVKYNKSKRKFEEIEIGYIQAEKTNLIVDLMIDGKSTLVPMVYDKKESAKNEGKMIYAANTLTDTKLAVGDYVVGSTSKTANIYKAETETKLIPIVSLLEFSEGIDEEEFTVVAFEKNVPCLPAEVTGTDGATLMSENLSYVTINTNEASWLSNIDIVEKLNRHSALNNYFVFELKNNTQAIDSFPKEGLSAIGLNRLEDTYDTNLYIPYTTSDNFVRQLAQHCTYSTLKGSPCHGVIGSEKLSAVTLSNIANKVNKVMELDFDLYAKKSNGNNMLDKDNMPYAIGQNVTMTFVQYTVTTGNGYIYTTNGASGYAGMVSTLEPDATSTNQSININNLSYSLSEYQITKLTKKGVITVKNSATKGLVITDGVTLAPVDSAYRRLSTTRIINYTAKILKAAVEPFIGRTDNLATKNSINTAIKSVLNKQVGSIIDKYDFKVTSTAEERRLGIIKINYSIVPFNEIRQIYNTIEITN